MTSLRGLLTRIRMPKYAIEHGGERTAGGFRFLNEAGQSSMVSTTGHEQDGCIGEAVLL